MECFIFVLVGWIFSVCLHEFGHAFVAFKGGDYTVEEKGYLTMNPIHYTHPVYSLALPIIFLLLGGIGLPGGAVYINDALLRSNRWRTGVALAGPAMNLILVLLLCLPFWFHWLNPQVHGLLAASLALLIQLQVYAILFNLLPVPSLDGFNAIAPWLPLSVREHALRHGSYYLWGLFIAFWYVPAVGENFRIAIYFITDVLHIDADLIWAGWQEFFSWKKYLSGVSG